MEEYLREFNYMASIAELEFSATASNSGIDFEWSGFNDSMPNFVNETLSRIQGLKNQNLSQIFAQVKEKLLLDLKNFYFGQPYVMAVRQLDKLLVNLSFEQNDLKAHLEPLTYDQFMEFL